jgi:hypothetical protein
MKQTIEATGRLAITLPMRLGKLPQVLMNGSQAAADVDCFSQAAKGWLGNFGRPFGADSGNSQGRRGRASA